MENLKVINQWNEAAASYSENQRNAPNNLTNWEIITSVIEDVKGKKVLDAGCGDGFFSNKLRLLGAEVSACDGAEALIEIGKKDFKDIEFKVCDLTKKLPYDNAQFDIVVSSLVLMDIEYLDEFFKQANRVLKDNGRLVFTIVHPCYFHADWEKDEKGNKLYKKIDHYWKIDKQTLNFWGETTHYHRPITWYTQKLKKYGFLIEEIKENPDNLEKFKVIKEHQKRIPLFMCFSCVKK